MKSNTIALIILATGNSKRLGRPKQLIRRGTESMIRHVVEKSEQSNLGPVYIITVAYNEIIKSEIPNKNIIHYTN